jgi:3-deoxy-manno-octulosonate cytidylyltransferase (CMP-KDO synthetase)
LRRGRRAGRKFWELNNPEDIPRIEAMMAEMGME